MGAAGRLSGHFFLGELGKHDGLENEWLERDGKQARETRRTRNREQAPWRARGCPARRHQHDSGSAARALEPVAISRPTAQQSARRSGKSREAKAAEEVSGRAADTHRGKRHASANETRHGRASCGKRSDGAYGKANAPVRRRQEKEKRCQPPNLGKLPDSPILVAGTFFCPTGRLLPGDELVEMRFRSHIQSAVVDRGRGHAAVGEFIGGKDVVGLGGREDRRLAILIRAVDLPVGDDR